ncbi:hypothetical protein GPECTOR_38g317 [Gonium pectorale]|uniref:Glutamine amidotransferase type-2 domain-containing protein n=1 Tax=Gonium pectorale TaxID=33097 RepID=A0A150GCM6_GONPE|nr:hypothetical protein GPECTOR_38g317 [Gonium pectorale]|eukprot:KXZ47080.1 hypothetical protein GPECTOR_38g317 [Gonium pectorale]
MLMLKSREFAEATAQRAQAQRVAAPAAQPQAQKFIYPGGGIHVAPAVTHITETLLRVTPYVHQSKDTIIVFFGTLSNLQDLNARRRATGKATPVPEEAGTGAMTTACLLDLYKQFGNGRELLMLSELQGQFAFVLYDSTRKQAFAARDPSGAEPLYYKVDASGGVMYTNSISQLPSDDSDRRAWQELQPGQYMLGKTVAQFALSLSQLERRERKESVDADLLHAQLQRESQQEEADRGGFSAVRSLIRNRSK